MGEVSWLNQALVVTCCDISMIVTSAEHAEQKERCPLFGDLSTKDMDHTNSQATQVHHRPTICRIPTDQKKGETLALRYRPLLKDTEISMSFNLPETAHRPGGLVESQLMQTEEEETRIEIN